MTTNNLQHTAAQHEMAKASTASKGIPSLVLTEGGRIRNSATNRKRVTDRGTLLDSGHMAGGDGRAWEDYLLGTWDKGQIIRVVFPSWIQRGEIELMRQSDWEGWQDIRDYYRGQD